MRAVVQRVAGAKVEVKDKIKGQIGPGLLVFIAVHAEDDPSKIPVLADKILKLRIFSDGSGKMNLSIKDIQGEIMVISQFTLYGDTQKGNRPSFTLAARPEKAIPLYDNFVKYIKESQLKIETGEFGADMRLELINDGPVTLIIDA